MAAFSERGFRATRVDDIVAGARTSHGTFYLYFDSKDDLFDQVVAEVAEEFRSLDESVPVLRNSAASRVELESWLVEFVEVYSRFGPLIRSWTEADRPGIDAGSDLLTGLAATFAARVKVRRRKDLDPELASLALLAMVERVNYFSVTGQISESPQQLARTMAAIIVDAFFGPGA